MVAIRFSSMHVSLTNSRVAFDGCDLLKKRKLELLDAGYGGCASYSHMTVQHLVGAEYSTLGVTTKSHLHEKLKSTEAA